MDRFFKRVFLIVLALVLLLAVLGAILSWQVGKHFTPGKFVATLEKNLNCRADAKACSVDLWGRVSTLKVSGLALSLRDKEADDATPLSTRNPVGSGLEVLAVDSLELTVNLTDLLRGRLDFKQLIMRDLHAHVVVREDDTNSFKDIFQKPQIVEGEPNAGVAASLPHIRLLHVAEQMEEPRGFGVYAKDLRIPATMDRAEIINGHVRIDKLEKQETMRFRNLHLTLTHVKIDHNHLDDSESNHCFIEIDTRLLIEDMATGKALIDFNLLGQQGEMIPFSPVDGQLNPLLEMEIEIAEGSKIDGHPLLKGFGHAIEMGREFGLDLGGYTTSVELSGATSARLRYEQQIIGWESELVLPMGIYGMGIGEGSWLDPETDSHHFNGFVALSEDATARALDSVEVFLQEKVPAEFLQTAVNTARTGLLDDRRRFRLRFESESNYDDPKVKIIPPFEVDDMLEDLLGDPKAIEGLLKGLLGK